MKPQLVGANYTSPYQFSILKSFIRRRSIDYVEILVDNFLSVNPESIADKLDGIPVAIHIMSSRFLDTRHTDLVSLAKPIRRIIETVKPIYVSDHIDQFSYRNRSLPVPVEYDYNLLEDAVRAVDMWQDLLGRSILLENFPSHDAAGITQPTFFDALISATGAGLLFDVSNAIVAQKNIGLSVTEWTSLLRQTRHFHMGGYSTTPEQPIIFIDSHDRKLSEDTRATAEMIFLFRSNGPESTLTIEFDHDVDAQDWEEDLRWARRLNKSGAQNELR